MDEQIKQQLIAAGRSDLVEADEITISGYAGVDPNTGMIVDRRKMPNAMAARENKALGIPPARDLPKEMCCSCEQPSKVKYKNECFRCKKPFQ